MEVGTALRAARRRAGLSQAALAARAGTSQATISAYESGAKAPSVATLDRLLGAAGARLTVELAPPPVVTPTRAQAEAAGRTFESVLALAEALPVRHRPHLDYPRLPVPAGGGG